MTKHADAIAQAKELRHRVVRELLQGCVEDPPRSGYHLALMTLAAADNRRLVAEEEERRRLYGPCRHVREFNLGRGDYRNCCCDCGRIDGEYGDETQPNRDWRRAGKTN